jgi:hypothetical protein
MSRAPLNLGSGMPQVAGAFAGWTNQITLMRRAQVVVNFLVTTVDTPFTFNGVIQPLKTQEINLYPDGLRAFTWLQIHTFSGAFDLKPDDQIVVNGKVYNVMGKRDYSRNGYIEYHLVYDYQGS